LSPATKVRAVSTLLANKEIEELAVLVA